jgi:ubiquinone biosynthesis protein
MGISLHPEHLKRYRDLAVLIAKYGRPGMLKQVGLDEAIDETEPTDPSEGDPKALGEALARDLEKMGPTYVKFGQLLSTRYDILPEAYCNALARLQDDVEPFAFSEVEQIVNAEVGLRISKAFSEFEPIPIAAASLGQVHRACLRDGRAVAVKVQRPGIRKTIADDLEALEQVADWVDAHTEFGRRHRLRGMLDEFRKSLVRELDYRREAQNLLTLGKNLEPFEHIIVPKPIDDYTSSRVLTMEYVKGVKITKLSDLARLDLPGKQLADELFRAYLRQILIDGFFHADPHPGNVFVTDDGRIALLDLGQVGYITPRLQEHLTQLVFAVSEGRSDDVVTYALRVSEKTPMFDEMGFAKAVADLVVTQQDTTIKQVEVGKIVLSLLEVSGRFGLIPAAELSMLGKALLNLDQVGYKLDPDFNPNEAIRESAAEIMKQRMQKSLSPGHVFQNMIEMKDFLERMPSRVNKILDAVANNELELRVQAIDEKKLISGFHKIANRITMGILMAALIIGAAMLIRVPTSFQLLGYPGIAIIFFTIAAVGAVGLMVQILRDDTTPSQ